MGGALPKEVNMLAPIAPSISVAHLQPDEEQEQQQPSYEPERKKPKLDPHQQQQDKKGYGPPFVAIHSLWLVAFLQTAN